MIAHKNYYNQPPFKFPADTQLDVKYCEVTGTANGDSFVSIATVPNAPIICRMQVFNIRGEREVYEFTLRSVQINGAEVKRILE